MAQIFTFDAHASSSDRPGPIARLRDRIADYFEYARIRDELRAFTDRELADIGLSRHDIDDVARAAVHGR